MSKFMQTIEWLLLPTIALVSLAVSLGDLFDLFHVIPAGQIPLLVLLITSIGLCLLGVIQNKCNEMRHDLGRLLARSELEQIDKIISQINLDLRKALSEDYFANTLKSLQTAMKEQHVQISDISILSSSFKQILQSYTRTTFLSTSSLATSYLWNNREIERALTCFIQGGGRIRQLFFVKSLEELASVEVNDALKTLQKLHIDVQVVDSTHIPADFKKHFFVEAKRKIAWEIPVDSQGHVASSIVTADEQAITTYANIFETLWRDSR
ncbi:MAG TPA: hypothetical protein VFV38_25375 [Ktedonobacteraceae bacterium]|nr:hypothetical protein [Ktedonobacteraceae bacterium]